MTKLMNSVLILVILCCGLHLSVGETLKCQFMYVDYPIINSLYTCKVTSLDNSLNNMRIDSYTGTHKANKDDNDVKAIYIDGTNMKYIPANLGSVFNLLALLIHNSELIAIKADDFLGMRNLECLSLYGNKLTSVSSNAFSTLTKLKVIWLMKNQIEEISSELFSNNLNLEYINLDNNKIKYIGSKLFNRLTKKHIKVSLIRNICVDNDYNGSTISDLKKEIKMNCDKPNDVIWYQIENKILKEFRDESRKSNEKNQLEFEVLKKKSDETEKKIEELNKMIEKLLQKSQ